MTLDEQTWLMKEVKCYLLKGSNQHSCIKLQKEKPEMSFKYIMS